MTREYRITTANVTAPSDNDCVLSPDDPASDIQRLQFLGGIGVCSRLHEYNAQAPEGSNISKTAMEKVRIMKEQDIQPGTPEWFQLWFSLPYLTGEKPVK